MNNYRKLTDNELHISAINAARLDRLAQLDTIAHLMEVDSRRLHSKMGYSSLFTYAVSALGFSEPAAGQRIQAMRLAQAIPAANIKIQSGEISISSAANVQRFIRKEEKENSRVFSDVEKDQIISEVSGKSTRDTVRTLLTFASKLEPHVLKEKIVPLTPQRTQLTFYVDPEMITNIERVRELHGELSLEEIFKSTLSFYLDRKDPARKPIKSEPLQSTTTSELGTHLKQKQSQKTELKQGVPLSNDMAPNLVRASSRYLPAALRQALQLRSGGRCEFVSKETGRRCEGRFRLEVEHKIPFSCGGLTDLSNCYYYCKSHNLYSAVETLGVIMKPYLSSKKDR